MVAARLTRESDVSVDPAHPSLPTMRCSAIVIVSLAATACASRQPEPLLSPVPTPAPVAAAPVVDTTRRDSIVTPVVSDSEVVRRAAAIFDGVPAVTTPEPSGPKVLDGPTWDIDVRSYETHDQVSQWVGIFTGRARGYIERSVSRGTRYDAMLRRKFREAGLPEDMTYLALIESSYLTSAYSRAAAVGMWQFMAPTARGIGMRVDWWIDERRDPIRATEGAIDFLTDLHNAYGSWYLAAAAYNGGPGRVSRGLRRFSDEMDGAEGEDQFFALAEQKYLPRETKAYVPKLIAAAIVAKEPARYGMRIDTLPPYVYDSVNVAGGASLAGVAKAAGTTLDVIRELNPHILRGVTPPSEVFEVRVPLGTAAGFNAAFNRLGESDRQGWREVRLGEARSAQALAEEAGVPLKSLRWINPRLAVDRRGRFPAGTLLRVPTTDAVAGARDVPDPSLVGTSSRGVTGGGSANSSDRLVAQRVRVRRGETLASIARRSGVSVKQLRALNGLSSGRVRAGQVLVVRRPSRKSIEAARRAASARSRSVATEQRCTTRIVRVRGKRRSVRSCAAVPATVRETEVRTERKCTNRVVRVRGKRRTVTSCTDRGVAPRVAPTPRQRGSSSAKAAPSRRGRTSSARPGSSTRRGTAKKAAPRRGRPAASAPKKKARR
jgi:membrane-bound lytic murein transglycosylase D